MRPLRRRASDGIAYDRCCPGRPCRPGSIQQVACKRRCASLNTVSVQLPAASCLLASATCAPVIRRQILFGSGAAAALSSDAAVLAGAPHDACVSHFDIRTSVSGPGRRYKNPTRAKTDGRLRFSSPPLQYPRPHHEGRLCSPRHLPRGRRQCPYLHGLQQLPLHYLVRHAYIAT